MSIARHIRTLISDRTGSVTVEFVAMTPVILVALVFSFEFGRALWAYDVMTRDVRAATRFLSRDSSANLIVRAQNVAETGSPVAGGTKHFPWSLATASFDTAPIAKTGTYGSTATVYRMSASLPINLSFLEAMNNFLNTDTIATSYTLVVSDEIRHIGE